jgi:hypothetical protein
LSLGPASSEESDPSVTDGWDVAAAEPSAGADPAAVATCSSDDFFGFSAAA